MMLAGGQGLSKVSPQAVADSMRLGHWQGLDSDAVEGTVSPSAEAGKHVAGHWKGLSIKAAAQCPHVVADSTRLAVGKGQPQMQ